MQRIVTAFFSVFFIFILILNSCVSHDFPEYTCTETIQYSEDILPIVETKCAISGCHNGDMGQDLNWTNFDKFHQRAENGMVKSRVTQRIMPPSNSPAGPLTQEQINAIACWTDQGSLNN